MHASLSFRGTPESTRWQINVRNCILKPGDGETMLTKTKTHIRIPRKDWERLRKNPQFSELIELLEDRTDLEAAKRVKGKDVTLSQYLVKRGIQNHR